MSTRGVYAALSGAMAQAQRLDTIANNIANVNTPGFKRDEQVFREYLTANEKDDQVLDATKIPNSIESFYDMRGGDISYVDTAGTYTDYSQGRLVSTGGQLDVAIDGQGFFEVMTPQGLRLTRQGGFNIDGQGQLVTKEGYPVMAQAEPGADPAARVVRVNGEGALRIAENGQVFQGNDALGQLAVVEVADRDQLSKIGNGFFDFKVGTQPELTNAANIMLRQGFIETSNVNIVKEMTDMISATRTFETAKKAIDAYDSMNDKLINQVAKV
jgi:flagellar basal-body rod protein FlgF